MRSVARMSVAICGMIDPRMSLRSSGLRSRPPSQVAFAPEACRSPNAPKSEGSGAPRNAGTCEVPGAAGVATRHSLSGMRSPLRSGKRASRRSTCGSGHGPRGLAWLSSGPRFLGRGRAVAGETCPSPAGSLQAGRTAGRAEPRSRPGAGLRARRAGAAPAFGSLARSSCSREVRPDLRPHPLGPLHPPNVSG
jgi:hypothetical protein